MLNCRILFALLGALMLIASRAADTDSPLPPAAIELREKYDAAAGNAAKDAQSELLLLQSRYVTGLSILADSLPAVDAQAVMEEIDRVEGAAESGESPTLPAAAEEMRTAYSAGRAKLLARQAAAARSLAEKLASLMEEIAAAEVAAGRSESAAAVRAEIAAVQSEFGLEAAAEKAPQPSLDPAEWPTSVAADTDFEVEIVREDAEASEFIYRTPHFQFESDVRLRTRLVREFSRIFEATFHALNALPLGLDLEPPADEWFRTKLFLHEADYLEAGGMPGSAGVYMGGSRMVMIPLRNLGVREVGRGFSLEDAGENHTLVHEITHQVMHDWLRKLPVWYTEGIAEYMAAAPYRNGRFTFTLPGRAMRDYLKSYKGVWNEEYEMNSAGRMLAMTDAEWSSPFRSDRSQRDRAASLRNYATAAILAQFFHHEDGEGDASGIRRYLAAVKYGTPEPEARDKFLVRGRSPEELDDEIARSMRRYDLKLSSLQE